MIHISAGHNTGGLKPDSGASGNGYNEADLTVIQRNLTTLELQKLNVPFITDKDTERLGEYLSRINTGNGSVVLEYHFDAFNGFAGGCTSLVGDDANQQDKDFAKEIVDITANTLKIQNRGVKAESESHRGKLGLMRESGAVCLLEVCFIDNVKDIALWLQNKEKLAVEIAKILKKYEEQI